MQDTMSRLDRADKFAQEYGDIETPEYQQAFTTYGSLTGLRPEQMKGFVALKMNAQLQKQRQLATQVGLVSQLRAPEYAKSSSPFLQAQVEDLDKPQPTSGAPNPTMGSLSSENRPSGGMQIPSMGPNQATSGVSGAEPVTVRRRTPVDLVAGQGPQVIPPTAAQAGQAQDYGQLSARAANWLMPPSDSGTPTQPMPAAVSRPAEGMGGPGPMGVGIMQRAYESLMPKTKQVTDKQLQADAVRAIQVDQATPPPGTVTAQNTPQTLEESGIENTDTAEQLQYLQDTLDRSRKRKSQQAGEGLPEGFDLRQDYQKRPEFYAKLFEYINKGIPDPQNPGQRRKLSMQEILTAINRGR
jgi:hypothetical protein